MWQLQNSIDTHVATLAELQVTQADDQAMNSHSAEAAPLSELSNKYLSTLKKEFELELVRILLTTLLAHYASRVDEEKRKTWFGSWFRSDFEVMVQSSLDASKVPNADLKKILTSAFEYNDLKIANDERLSNLKNAIRKFFPIKSYSESNFIKAVKEIECDNSVLCEKRDRLCNLAETQAGILEDLFNQEASVHANEEKSLNKIPGFSSDAPSDVQRKALISYAEARCPALINENALGSAELVATDLRNSSSEDRENNVAVNKGGYSLVNPEDIDHMSDDELDNLETGSVGSSVVEPSPKDQERADRKKAIFEAISEMYIPIGTITSNKNDTRALMAGVREKIGSGWNWFSFKPSEYATINKLLVSAGESVVDDAVMMAALRRIKRLEDKYPQDEKKKAALEKMRLAFWKAYDVSKSTRAFSKTQKQIGTIKVEVDERSEVHALYLKLESQVAVSNNNVLIARESIEKKSESELQSLVYSIAVVNSKANQEVTLGKSLADPMYAGLLRCIKEAGLFEKSKSICFLVLVIGVQLVHAKNKNQQAYDLLWNFLKEIFAGNYQGAVKNFKHSKNFASSGLDWLSKYFLDSVESLSTKVSSAARVGEIAAAPFIADNGLFPSKGAMPINVSRSASTTSVSSSSLKNQEQDRKAIFSSTIFSYMKHIIPASKEKQIRTKAEAVFSEYSEDAPSHILQLYVLLDRFIEVQKQFPGKARSFCDSCFAFRIQLARYLESFRIKTEEQYLVIDQKKLELLTKKKVISSDQMIKAAISEAINIPEFLNITPGSSPQAKLTTCVGAIIKAKTLCESPENASPVPVSVISNNNSPRESKEAPSISGSLMEGVKSVEQVVSQDIEIPAERNNSASSIVGASLRSNSRGYLPTSMWSRSSSASNVLKPQVSTSKSSASSGFVNPETGASISYHGYQAVCAMEKDGFGGKSASQSVRHGAFSPKGVHAEKIIETKKQVELLLSKRLTQGELTELTTRANGTMNAPAYKANLEQHSSAVILLCVLNFCYDNGVKCGPLKSKLHSFLAGSEASVDLMTEADDHSELLKQVIEELVPGGTLRRASSPKAGY